MGPHVREGVKDMIFILNPKSYKLELLGELVVKKSLRRGCQGQSLGHKPK